MKTRTKRGLLRLATATALVCAATLVFFPSLASTKSAYQAAPDALSISSIRIG